MYKDNRDESARPSISCETGILVALLKERGNIMSLVTDNWATNLNPTPKPFKMYKTLSATAVSGSAVTDTENIFSKDCPFPVKIVGFEVQSVLVTSSDFVGSGSAMTVALQSSDEVDTSPASPTVVSWDTVVTVNASGSASATDKMLFSAPSNVSGMLNPSMDQSFVAVPKGGSLRATLSAQAKDAVSTSTTLELLAIVTCVPTALKEQRYF